MSIGLLRRIFFRDLTSSGSCDGHTSFYPISCRSLLTDIKWQNLTTFLRDNLVIQKTQVVDGQETRV